MKQQINDYKHLKGTINFLTARLYENKLDIEDLNHLGAQLPILNEALAMLIDLLERDIYDPSFNVYKRKLDEAKRNIRHQCSNWFKQYLDEDKEDDRVVVTGYYSIEEVIEDFNSELDEME